MNALWGSAIPRWVKLFRFVVQSLRIAIVWVQIQQAAGSIA